MSRASQTGWNGHPLPLYATARFVGCRRLARRVAGRLFGLDTWTILSMASTSRRSRRVHWTNDCYFFSACVRVCILCLFCWLPLSAHCCLPFCTCFTRRHLVGVSLVAGSRCPAPLFVLLISCAFFVVCLLGVVSCHNLHMSFYTGEPFFSRWQFPCVLFCMCLTCGRLSSRPHSVTLSRTLECPRSHLVGRRVVSNIVPGRFFFNKKLFHLFFFPILKCRLQRFA